MESSPQSSFNAMAQKIAQRDYEKAQAEVDKWEKYYQLALKSGDQNLVRTAQFQQERFRAIADKLKALVNQQKPQKDTPDTQTHKDNPNSAIDTYTQIEHRIMQIQADIEAISQQNEANQEINFNTEDIEQELTMLKNEIQSIAPQKQTSNQKEEVFDGELLE